MKNIQLQLSLDEFETRINALRALHELQNILKDDPVLQNMTDDDIIREVKEIRKELASERKSSTKNSG